MTDEEFDRYQLACHRVQQEEPEYEAQRERELNAAMDGKMSEERRAQYRALRARLEQTDPERLRKLDQEWEQRMDAAFAAIKAALPPPPAEPVHTAKDQWAAICADYPDLLAPREIMNGDAQG